MDVGQFGSRSASSLLFAQIALIDIQMYDKGVCVLRCNLPPAFVAERPFFFFF